MLWRTAREIDVVVTKVSSETRDGDVFKLTVQVADWSKLV